MLLGNINNLKLDNIHFTLLPIHGYIELNILIFLLFLHKNI